MSDLFKYIAALGLAMTALCIVTSSAAQYVVGVNVYVDKAGIEKWQRVTGKTGDMALWRELNSTFYEMNQLFRTLDKHDLNVRLQISNLFFMNENILRPNRQGDILNKDSLDQFEAKISSTFANDKYDVAVLLTGYNLVRSQFADDAYGYAYIGTVCTPTALAVLELHGTYLDVLSGAHEIAHVLGAPHDGSLECPSNSGHVMNAMTQPESPNHFIFSSCSAAMMKYNLDTLENDCLTMWNPAAAITGPRFGSMMKPDEICQRKFGRNSYIVRSEGKPYGNSMCTSVACLKQSSGDQIYWEKIATPQGLKCGKNKVCSQGKCEYSDFGDPNVSDTCPLGDQPGLDCRSMVRQNGCTGDVLKACCESCNGGQGSPVKPNRESNDPGTADEVCKKTVGESSDMARLYYSRYGNNLCSRLTCITAVDGDYFRWRYIKAPNGMKCGRNKRCNNGRCVWSETGGDPNMSDTCPYGDQPWIAGHFQMDCSTYVSQYGCSGNTRNMCCATCQ